MEQSVSCLWLYAHTAASIARQRYDLTCHKRIVRTNLCS